MAAGRQRMVIGDINITPLTDIFLVMLIIMMVLAPSMANRPPDLAAPEIQSGNVVNEKAIQVTITEGGGIQVQGVDTPEDQLAEALKIAVASQASAGTSPGQATAPASVSITADKETDNSKIFAVLKAAQAAGIAQAAIIGAQKEK